MRHVAVCWNCDRDLGLARVHLARDFRCTQPLPFSVDGDRIPVRLSWGRSPRTARSAGFGISVSTPLSRGRSKSGSRPPGLEDGGRRVSCYAHLQWDAAPSRSGAGARTASEKRPSARNGSLPPLIKGAAAADSGADNPVGHGHRAADHARPHNGLPVAEVVSRAHSLTSLFGSSTTTRASYRSGHRTKARGR
jgi:hypothetical protein